VKILVVRRDNIGDLVVTTPVFRALRSHFPGARIEALVNSYNAPVLENHPDVDAIHAYVKSKHRENGTALGGWLERLRQMAGLREARFDLVLVPRPGYHPREIRLARWVGGRQLCAFVARGHTERGVHLPMESRQWDGVHHHLEDTFRLLEMLGIPGPPPAQRLGIPVPARKPGAALVIGIHASARRPANRWPHERFAPLMRALNQRFGATFRLFWAPGAANDPRHPGDDACAQSIVAAASGLPVEAIPTVELRDLIRSLAACDALVCCDGGAMHIAAALGKPIVCFFGDSPAYHWRPWGVPQRLLQPPSRNAADVSVEETVAAFADLAAETRLA
jgi:ADP-heptose:LPS heptosyltransferase